MRSMNCYRLNRLDQAIEDRDDYCAAAGAMAHDLRTWEEAMAPAEADSLRATIASFEVRTALAGIEVRGLQAWADRYWMWAEAQEAMLDDAASAGAEGW